MVEYKKTWAEMKALIDSRHLKLQYTEYDEAYQLELFEGQIIYSCNLPKDGGADVLAFEASYKSDSNDFINPKTSDGKDLVVSSSRPVNTVTCFTTRGDDTVAGIIAAGQRMEWDFSNSDGDVTAPTNFTRKRLVLKFIDPVYVKEGTLYFHNAVKGSYLDFYVVCPSGHYYLKNDGTPALAGSDTIVTHYVVEHPMQGSVPMGDELNTEQATDSPVPTNYELWIEITVPDTDTTSNGCAELELYRTRTVVLE